ncbi:MAG: PKD domain-containing protein [Planctomycetes bacterium]|nr:PKD domain-containing protein [Planctomycetota bacterium]
MRSLSNFLQGGALLALLAPAAEAQSCLQTLYTNDGGSGVNSSVFFNVTASSAVLVSRFDMSYNSSPNRACGLEVWITPTTYVGKTAQQALWTQVGVDNGLAVTAGFNLPTTVNLLSPFLLNPGTYGMCLVYRGQGSSYSVGNGTNQTYYDGFLSLALGQSQSGTFSGTLVNARVWNGAICYSPAGGLFAGFSATPTSGATPLNVNFTDGTSTSDPGGVTSWAWDFDGDSIIDSNAQNPSFTYTRCGLYDVTLTVTDSQHPSSTRTENDFIFADPQLVVTANFRAASNAGAVPLTVNFTDTSVGNPTAWSWDFDNDSIIDSTAQSPSFTYTTPGFYSVTLNAANACFTDGETKTNFIQVVGATQNTVSADKLEYQFNEVRGTAVSNVASSALYPATGTIPNASWHKDPGRALFKGSEAGFGSLSQTPSSTPTRNWVDTGSNFRHTGSLTVMWWARRDPSSIVASPFGYFFGDDSFRCFFASAGISFGGGTGTTLSATYTANWQGHLQQGVWHHYAVVIDDAVGFNTIYQDGVPHAGRNYAPGTYTYNGTTGFAVGAFSVASGGGPASEHYDLDDFRMYSRALTQAEIQTALLHENPTGALMDPGCTDSNSFTPSLTAVGAPQIGNLAFGLLASGLEPGRPTAVYIGLSASLGGFLPFDLSGTGVFGPGCRLLVSPDIILNFGSGGGSVFLPAPVPLDPTLEGGHIYNQLLSLGSGPLSAVSNAIDTQMQF